MTRFKKKYEIKCRHYQTVLGDLIYKDAKQMHEISVAKLAISTISPLFQNTDEPRRATGQC